MQPPIKPTIQNSRWILPLDIHFPKLREKLSSLGQLEPLELVRREFDLYDSFPNDLWFAHWHLTKEGEVWVLSDPQGDRVEGKANDPSPHYWWDFCKGELQTPLRSHLNIRGLLFKMHLCKETQILELKNEDGKIMIRLNYEDHFVKVDGHWRQLQKIIELQPLLGYEQEAEDLVDKIDQFGWQKGSDSMVRLAYETLGTLPKPYSSKPNFRLKADEAALEVVCSMMQDLIHIMRINEMGIANDVDTEFLHDYRVSVRRVRSLIAQLKAVFSDEQFNDLKQSFSVLCQKTNLMRDLDVYLLSKNDYLDMLPKRLRSGAEVMFKDFEKQRKVAQKKLQTFLKSSDYRKEMTRLENFSKRSHRNTVFGVAASVAILELAQDKIYKRYNRVRKCANSIDENTSDEVIHELRIQCKRLRYLLEFFESLFNKKKIIAIVKKLKILQDSLGKFNDFSVQQNKLLEYSQHHSKSSPQLHLAIGGMVSILGLQQNEERYRVLNQLKKFRASAVKKEFEVLFFKPSFKGEST